jgi:hypothetical protein
MLPRLIPGNLRKDKHANTAKVQLTSESQSETYRMSSRMRPYQIGGIATEGAPSHCEEHHDHTHASGRDLVGNLLRTQGLGAGGVRAGPEKAEMGAPL